MLLVTAVGIIWWFVWVTKLDQARNFPSMAHVGDDRPALAEQGKFSQMPLADKLLLFSRIATTGTAESIRHIFRRLFREAKCIRNAIYNLRDMWQGQELSQTIFASDLDSIRERLFSWPNENEITNERKKRFMKIVEWLPPLSKVSRFNETDMGFILKIYTWQFFYILCFRNYYLVFPQVALLIQRTSCPNARP